MYCILTILVSVFLGWVICIKYHDKCTIKQWLKNKKDKLDKNIKK